MDKGIKRIGEWRITKKKKTSGSRGNWKKKTKAKKNLNSIVSKTVF